jgi:hypothetical protein
MGGFVPVLCQSPVSLSHLGLECLWVDIAHFWLEASAAKSPQPACRDTQTVVAVRNHLVPARADRLDPVHPHQPANAPRQRLPPSTLSSSSDDLMSIELAFSAGNVCRRFVSRLLSSAKSGQPSPKCLQSTRTIKCRE